MNFKKVGRLALVPVVAAAVALGFASRVDAAAAGTAPAFTASQLADAVLFDQGPAAPYLAAIERSTNRWTDAARRHHDGIVTAIEADPRWSASFASRVQSGNAVTVEAALRDLGVLAQAQADRLFGADSVDRAVAEASQGTVLVALTPPTLDHDLNLVVQQVDMIVTLYIIADSFTIEPGESAKLLHEQLVYEVTSKLRTK